MANFFALNQALQGVKEPLFKLINDHVENKQIQLFKQEVLQQEQEIDSMIQNTTDENMKQSLLNFKTMYSLDPTVNAVKSFNKGNFDAFKKQVTLSSMFPDYQAMLKQQKTQDTKITQIGTKPVLGIQIPEAERPQYFNPDSYYQNVNVNGVRKWELVGAEGGGNYWQLAGDKQNIIFKALDKAMDVIGLKQKAIFSGKSTEEVLQLLSGNPAALNNLITRVANNDKAKEEEMRKEIATLGEKWLGLVDDDLLKQTVKKMIREGAIGTFNTTPTDTGAQPLGG